MWYLPKRNELSVVLFTARTSGKVISTVYLGPAGLVNIKDVNEQPLVAAPHTTVFNNSKEKVVSQVLKATRENQ